LLNVVWPWAQETKAHRISKSVFCFLLPWQLKTKTRFFCYSYNGFHSFIPISISIVATAVGATAVAISVAISISIAIAIGTAVAIVASVVAV
jgi:hypothetical protein